MAPAYTFLVSVRSASTKELPAWSRAAGKLPLNEDMSGASSG